MAQTQFVLNKREKADIKKKVVDTGVKLWLCYSFKEEWRVVKAGDGFCGGEDCPKNKNGGVVGRESANRRFVTMGEEAKRMPKEEEMIGEGLGLAVQFGSRKKWSARDREREESGEHLSLSVEEWEGLTRGDRKGEEWKGIGMGGEARKGAREGREDGEKTKGRKGELANGCEPLSLGVGRAS